MPPQTCLFEENHTEIDAAIASPFAAHVAITHEIDLVAIVSTLIKPE